MVKILLVLCVLIVLLTGWIVCQKIYKTQKIIRKLGLKATSYRNKPAVSQIENQDITVICMDEIDLYEQQLFDDIATLFLAEHSSIIDYQEAAMLQSDVLRKMPAKTKSHIRQLDLGEWSIYWIFYNQSLEYYVGQYGIFSSHVDRDGNEHRQENQFSKQRVSQDKN